MERRRFVAVAAAAGLGVAAGAGAIGWGADGPKRVPLNIDIQPSWLTWVTSVTACLRALGIDCDNVDVAGQSGYAFHMCVTSAVDVYGPTFLPWEELAAGVRRLGRSTLEYQMGDSTAKDDWPPGEAMRFDIAKREIDAGRPCVLWGIEMPEFAAVVGYEGDEYIYRWAGDRGKEERMQFGKSSDPGGPYLLAFPSTTQMPKDDANSGAVRNALEFLHRRPYGPDHRFGPEGYAVWMTALRGGKVTAFGNSYCAQCFADAKRMAELFVGRLAKRNPAAEGPLSDAMVAYQACADAMKKVADVFPFPPKGNEPVTDEKQIGAACDGLRAAEAAETRAVKALETALEAMWAKAK
jgi:hypothetical protein